MAKIEEVGIQKDDKSQTYMETNQEIAEVAIQVDDQSETSSETSLETNQGATKLDGEDVAVSVDELKIFMKKLGELPGEALKKRFVTIFRLPGWIHENNKLLCEPKIVAIGPYHHGKKSLQTMEEHKWYVLRNFLARNNKVDFEGYLQAMRSIEADARNCYSETVDLTSDEFVIMLLLDSCFLLELLSDNVSGEDAIYGTGWAIYIYADILLLENQLPFFVIHKIFELANQHEGLACHENCKSDDCSLHSLIRDFNGFFPIVGPFKPLEIACSDIYHLLHFYHICTVPDSPPKIKRRQRKLVPRKLHHLCGLSFSWSKLFLKKSTLFVDDEFVPIGINSVSIQCITELHDAGIKFKRKEKPRNLLDISFKNGIIEMPFFQTNPLTVGLLWNMSTLEQSLLPSSYPQTISSYLALMDSLINTEKDFAMLDRFGIVDNQFQNAEEASTFFNKFDIFFGLDYDDHYFCDLLKEIKEYSESIWHRHRARLMQDYFSNPWTIISVVAAGILLVLSVVQTYYSAAK